MWRVSAMIACFLVAAALSAGSAGGGTDKKNKKSHDPVSLEELSTTLRPLLGRLPSTADHVDWEGWRFEVVDLDGKRVDKVLVTRGPEPALESASK